MRVALDCCLQEARWNPYYAHLALKLTAASKSHKVCAGCKTLYPHLLHPAARMADNDCRCVPAVLAVFQNPSEAGGVESKWLSQGRGILR